MSEQAFVITSYEPQYAEQTVSMWRDSKEKAIGQKEKHSIDSHIYFLVNILPKQFEIYLAFIEDKVVGMIAFNSEEINQLYIHVEYRGYGIGRTLLQKAKEHSSGRLTLRTFEVNKNAQRFYEKNGFTVIGKGHANEENLPDLEYEWLAE